MDFGLGFSDQIFVGIRQNPNRGHFRPKICRPVLPVHLFWPNQATDIKLMENYSNQYQIKFFDKKIKRPTSDIMGVGAAAFLRFLKSSQGLKLIF